MENNPITISQAIIQLLPVIVGGFIAIGGSIIASLISQKKQASQKKAELKAQKLEELLNLVYESCEWLENYRSEWLFNGPKVQESCPINLVKVLSNLYFNAIEKEVNILDALIINYKQWVIKEAQYRGEHKSFSPTSTQDFQKIYQPLLSAKTKLEKKISQLSSHKF